MDEHVGTLVKTPKYFEWTPTCNCGWRGEPRWEKATARKDHAAHLDDPDAEVPATQQRSLAEETEPPAWMSTHALKTELLIRLAELQPNRRWPKQVAVTELAEHAIHTLDAHATDPNIRRTLKVAGVLWPHERR